jgi:hypothetical protein
MHEPGGAVPSASQAHHTVAGEVGFVLRIRSSDFGMRRSTSKCSKKATLKRNRKGWADAPIWPRSSPNWSLRIGRGRGDCVTCLPVAVPEVFSITF